MCDNTEYYIFLNGFWRGFAEKIDANTVDIFEKIFSKTILKNFKITNNLNIANVLFESVFGNTLANIKNWKYKIFFSGEPYITNPEKYDLLMFSHETEKNIVDIPLYVVYMYENALLNRIINKPKITKIPEKFCCFIVSNESCPARNNMFQYLNQYKKVESCGRFANNMQFVIQHSYWSEEFRNFISNYKFIICFENNKQNTYSTEKIVNPYVAGSIPIYWGSSHIHNVFNKNSMLYLEDESIESYQKIINEIIELDNSDEKYLEFINRPAITDLSYFNNNYTIDVISQKIDKVLRMKQ
jgi:alpha(1,3/1,4) fucosyltransferase